MKIKVGASYRTVLVYDYERDMPDVRFVDGHESLFSLGRDGAGAVLNTGTYVGYVAVDYAAGPTPRPLDLDAWDRAEQIIIPTPNPSLYITPPMGEGEISGNLITSPGPIVLRAAVIGWEYMFQKEIGPSSFDTYEPSEKWFIDVWPKGADDASRILK